MTEANDQSLALDSESSQPLTETAPAPKKTPRRKIAARPKASIVQDAVNGDSENEKAVKTRRPRRKTASDEPAETPELTSAAAQPELLPPPSASRSSDPQTQVETQTIPKKVMEELKERTTENFGHDGNIPTPDSAPSQNQSAPVPAPDAPAHQVTGKPAAEPHQAPWEESTMAPTAPAHFVPDVPEPARLAPDVPEPAAPPYPTQTQQYQPQHQPPQREGRGGRPDQGQGGGPQNRFDRPQQQSSGGQPHHQQQQRHERHDRHDRQDRGDRHDRNERHNRPPQQQQQPYPQSPQSGGGGGGESAVMRITEAQYGEGIIEVSGKGFGFLREAKRNFVQTPADIFVTPEVCRKYNLRDGQWIKGEIRRSSRGPQLFRLTALNGEDPEKFRNLPIFEELTTINPRKRIKLETVPERYTTRIMDLMTPIGKGQRGLIVAPPRTGKTTLLQHIAEAVVLNHPEMKLIILLVDERPEEVTEIRRTVPQAEIMASSNDSDLKSHTRIAQLAMERSKRLVEAGQHVFILLDSITRMARAFNNSMGGSRATGSGGLTVGALEIPRKIFAAARNTEEAGSLTIMATALIETNSKMDDAIFQEFKGTGNMELVLDRKISDQRIYPAVDIFLSGTRREELLLQPWELDKINVIRRGLAGHKPIEAIERLLSFLRKFPTNAQMLASLPG
jgi:transcription termination factor Rho